MQPYYAYKWMVAEEEHPSDDITLVITLHISTEYWLGRLFQHRCELNEEIFDTLNLSYAVVLKAVHKMGMIDGDLYHNLTVLNRIRNHYAHNLDFHFYDDQLDFVSADIDFRAVRKDYADRFNPKSQAKIDWSAPFDYKKIFEHMGKVTLGILENHCIKDIGLAPPEDS